MIEEPPVQQRIEPEDDGSSPDPRERPDIARKPRWVLWMGLAGVALLYLYANRPVPASFTWRSDLGTARDEARATGRMILLEFQTEGCPACVYMDREVFSRPEVAEALADWVPVRVDGNVEQALSAQYGIEAFPTFLALAADGQVLAGFVGAREFTEFIDFLQLARERAAPGGQIPSETTPVGSGRGRGKPSPDGSTAIARY